MVFPNPYLVLLIAGRSLVSGQSGHWTPLDSGVPSTLMSLVLGLLRIESFLSLAASRTPKSILKPGSPSSFYREELKPRQKQRRAQVPGYILVKVEGDSVP